MELGQQYNSAHDKLRIIFLICYYRRVELLLENEGPNFHVI